MTVTSQSDCWQWSAAHGNQHMPQQAEDVHYCSFSGCRNSCGRLLLNKLASGATDKWDMSSTVSWRPVTTHLVFLRAMQVDEVLHGSRIVVLESSTPVIAHCTHNPGQSEGETAS